MRNFSTELLEDNRKDMMDMAGISSWYWDVESDKRICDAGPHCFPEIATMKEFAAHVNELDGRALRSLIRLMLLGNRKKGSVAVRFSDKTHKGGFIYLDMLCTPRMMEGKVTGLFFLTNDITQLKLKEIESIKQNSLLTAEKMKLKTAYSLLSSITNRMPCVFFAKDVDRDFIYYMANSAFCRLVGKELSQVIGHTDAEVFTDMSSDEFRKGDMWTVQKGSYCMKEETHIGGVKKTWQTVKFLTETPDNKRLVMCMATDVTDIYNAYEEVNKAKLEAERSDKMKSVFLQNVCHELVSPLNSVLGFSQLLVDAETEDEKRELDAEITENGHLLKEIIEEIIDLTKVESGINVIKTELFDLSDYIRQMEQTFGPKVGEGVEFRVEVPHHYCVVNLDKEHLTKIINRGVMNAISCTYSGYVALGYECVEGGVKIYVEDTGIGLSEEEAMTINGQYENVNGFTESMAFSLSLCKILAKIMGGTVDFTSSKGVKSKIWIYLPTDTVIQE